MILLLIPRLQGKRVNGFQYFRYISVCFQKRGNKVIVKWCENVCVTVCWRKDQGLKKSKGVFCSKTGQCLAVNQSWLWPKMTRQTISNFSISFLLLHFTPLLGACMHFHSLFHAIINNGWVLFCRQNIRENWSKNINVFG
jgi:hypothetical protein